MPTVVELDQILADWTGKLDVISHNLLELDENFTYQRLAGKGGFPPATLTGQTAARVNAALDAVRQLWQAYDQLGGVIEQARAKRQQANGMFGGGQRLQEALALLNGRSVQRPATLTQFAQRNLLTPAESTETISPAELLAVMTRSYQLAKETICSVEDAWTRLEPAITAATDRLRQMERRAKDWGIVLPELPGLLGRVQAVASQIKSDPLAVAQGWDADLHPLLTKLEGQIEEVAQARSRLDSDFTLARDRLWQLKQLHEQAMSAEPEFRQKITDWPAPPAASGDGALPALEQWLERLEGRRSSATMQALRVGLDNWLARCAETLAQEQRAANERQSALALRRELRGRLDALQAKAHAMGRVESRELTAIAEEARSLLFARPTPLRRADNLVRQYEQILNQRPAGVS